MNKPQILIKRSEILNELIDVEEAFLMKIPFQFILKESEVK